uniref:Uncharacterized protein n=1 Tax=Aegilops tauschii subsp. strangulata TaxID=200361 RepID=A0A453K786_AEGTS
CTTGQVEHTHKENTIFTSTAPPPYSPGRRSRHRPPPLAVDGAALPCPPARAAGPLPPSSRRVAREVLASFTRRIRPSPLFTFATRGRSPPPPVPVQHRPHNLACQRRPCLPHAKLQQRRKIELGVDDLELVQPTFVVLLQCVHVRIVYRTVHVLLLGMFRNQNSKKY